MAKRNVDPFVEWLLTNWAQWAKGRLFGIGYNSTTIEARLMKEGVLLSSAGAPTEEFNEPAEKVEKILLRMPRKMQKVVKIEYLVYGNRKHKQEICRLGRRKYEDFLRSGESRVNMEYESASELFRDVRPDLV